MIQRPESQTLFDRSKKITPGGVHSPVRAFKGVGGTPPFIRSSQGTRLHDVDGNEYIDYCMSWGPLIFGHQDPETHQAVSEALNRGWSYGTAEPYSLELATFITSRLPWIEKIRFVNSGTEAVMTALRLARGFTNRSKILKFDGCYHGHTDSMLVRAGSGLAEMSVSDSAGVPSSAANDTLVAPLNDLNAVERIFSEYGKDIAAVIIEPLPANNGLLIQKEGYLESLAQITRDAGAVLIFDEVISGFRVAFGGMAEKTQIRPDLVTYGKVIGGGFPVGAVGGREDILNCLAPMGNVYQAGTLSANPIAMVAGLTTLEKLFRKNPYPQLEKKTQHLALLLSNSKYHIQTFGSIFWICSGEIQSEDGQIRALEEFPKTAKESYPPFYHFLLEHGYYLAPSAFEVGFMSTVHTSEENQKLAELILEYGERSLR